MGPHGHGIHPRFLISVSSARDISSGSFFISCSTQTRRRRTSIPQATSHTVYAVSSSIVPPTQSFFFPVTLTHGEGFRFVGHEPGNHPVTCLTAQAKLDEKGISASGPTAGIHEYLHFHCLSLPARSATISGAHRPARQCQTPRRLQIPSRFGPIVPVSCCWARYPACLQGPPDTLGSIAHI